MEGNEKSETSTATKINLGLGAISTAWGAKENLINLAAKYAPEIEELKYVKGVKLVTKGLFVAQIAVSGIQVYNAWNSDNGNKWGVTGKATLDVAMAAVGTFGGPIGWVVSGTYFLGDAAGLWGTWVEADLK